MSLEIKINNTFYQKLSPESQRKVQDHVLTRASWHCYGFLMAGGFGKTLPSGGIPVSVDGNKNTSFYMGFLKDHHNYKNRGYNRKEITTNAPYWKNVIYGVRPTLNPFSGKEFKDVNPYTPNPYNKRAKDNMLKNRVPQQAMSEAMRMYGFKK